MDYSQKISERQWNLPEKGELESRREETYIDDIIQKDHIQRKLLEHMDGIRTVFDGGAGSGRFPALPAKQGCRVTHFDISQPMIDKAKELAEAAGVSDRITFVKGAHEELNNYPNKSFDLVMSFDAPISYTYPNQNRVIENLMRMAKKRKAFSVSSRLGTLPYLCNPVQKTQFILDEKCADPFVQWSVANCEKMIRDFHFDKQNAERVMTDELERILRGFGVRNIQLSGPGAYGARFRGRFCSG